MAHGNSWPTGLTLAAAVTGPTHDDVAYALSDVTSILLSLFAVVIWRGCNSHPLPRWRKTTLWTLVGVCSCAAACVWIASHEKRFRLPEIHALASLVLSVFAPAFIGFALSSKFQSKGPARFSIAYGLMQIPGYVYLGSSHPDSVGLIAASALHVLGVSKIIWVGVVLHQTYRLDAVEQVRPASIRLDAVQFILVIVGLYLHAVATAFFMHGDPDAGWAFFTVFAGGLAGLFAVIYYFVNTFVFKSHQSTPEEESHEGGERQKEEGASVVAPATPPVAPLPSAGSAVGIAASPIGLVAGAQSVRGPASRFPFADAAVGASRADASPPGSANVEFRMRKIAVVSDAHKSSELTLVVCRVVDGLSLQVGRYRVSYGDPGGTKITPSPRLRFAAPRSSLWSLEFAITVETRQGPHRDVAPESRIHRLDHTGVALQSESGQAHIAGIAPHWNSMTFSWSLRQRD